MTNIIQGSIFDLQDLSELEPTLFVHHSFKNESNRFYFRFSNTH